MRRMPRAAPPGGEAMAAMVSSSGSMMVTAALDYRRYGKYTYPGGFVSDSPITFREIPL